MCDSQSANLNTRRDRSDAVRVEWAPCGHRMVTCPNGAKVPECEWAEATADRPAKACRRRARKGKR